MKYLGICTALFASALTTLAHAGTNVGVAVDINQAGAYGRIELGNRPPPPVIYQQPIIISRPVVVASQPTYVQPAPIYLKVPPGHSKKWAKHCHRYNACGQPVYFVKYEESSGQEHSGKSHPGKGHHGKGHHGKGRD